MLGQMLIERGHDVTGIDTGFHRVGWLYNGAKKTPTTVTKDIRNITEEDLKGFEAVVHLAELSNDPVGELTPNITYDINHIGTIELAKKTALVAPRTAVLPDDDKQVLFTVKDGKAVRHEVKVGISTDDLVEVSADDLHEGDQVVVLGNYELENGMAIQTAEKETKDAADPKTSKEEKPAKEVSPPKDAPAAKDAKEEKS